MQGVLEGLDWVVIGLYFFVLLVLALWIFFQKNKNTEDYSFVLYLQDSENGHTCFEIDNKIVKVKPEKGKLVFFPSDIWHWGEKSSGKKKIAVGALKCVD